MAAFRRAVDDGADGLEFDVQLTSDREPVVIHDETLGRTTDGVGWVKDCTLAEIMAWTLLPDARASRASGAPVGRGVGVGRPIGVMAISN